MTEKAIPGESNLISFSTACPNSLKTNSEIRPNKELKNEIRVISINIEPPKIESLRLSKQ